MTVRARQSSRNRRLQARHEVGIWSRYSIALASGHGEGDRVIRRPLGRCRSGFLRWMLHPAACRPAAMRRLCNGEVRRPRVGDVIDGHAGSYGVGDGEHHLAGSLGDGVGAEEHAGVGVGHQLHRTSSVVVRQRPGDLRKGEHPALAVVTGLERLHFGEAGRGELRTGEDNRRQARVIHQYQDHLLLRVDRAAPRARPHRVRLPGLRGGRRRAPGVHQVGPAVGACAGRGWGDPGTPGAGAGPL